MASESVPESKCVKSIDKNTEYHLTINVSAAGKKHLSCHFMDREDNPMLCSIYLSTRAMGGKKYNVSMTHII